MAHFLSDVTHERMQQRANYNEAANPDRLRTYIPGLTHTHDFAATMRCTAVLERTIEDEKLGPNAVIKSWSGDLDGTISIRHGLDGKVVKKIPQEHLNVFVFALQQYKETMWAGLSNGYLVVYDINTTSKIFEAKAHGGAINRFLLGGDKIFIASADWQISQWNAADMTRITNGSFSGHTNAVRCIALDGTLLYSGGDDCVIRCWDLATNTERTGTWPIIAHHDSVRDIVVFDSFLFSSSTDGTINVWNIRTAQLVRQLEVVNASITTLCLDTASNYLWAGSSDGNINIWNASTLSLVGLVDDHENTNVAAIRQVARVDAIKAWTVCSDGNVRIWYADNNPTDDEYLAVSQMEAELQQHIEDHRNRIIANYEELERYKRELGTLEQQSADKKNKLSHLLGRQQSATLQRKHLALALMWLDKQRYRVWASESMAPLAERVSSKAVLARYYAGWQAIARERRAARYKKEVSAHMAEYQKDIAVRAYLLKIAQSQQAAVEKNNREHLAAMLAKTNNAIVADRYYATLKAFVRARGTSRRMEQLSFCVAATANRSLLASYWQKMLLAADRAKAQRIAERAPAVAQSLADAYDASEEKSAHEARIAAYDARYAALKAKQESAITPYVFELAEDRDNTIALAAAKAEEDEIAELEAFIAASEGLDEDALDRELMAKQMELVMATAATGDDLEQQILALQMRNFKLTREHEREVIVKIDTEHLTPLDQVDHAMYLLKANAVSCYHHTARREAARARIAAAKSAEKVYKEAFEEFKKKITKAVKPIPLQDGDEPEWFAPKEYMNWMKRPSKATSSTQPSAARQAKLDAMNEDERTIEMRRDAEKAAEARAKAIKLRNKAILDANDSIVDLCVAYDTLNPKQKNAWVNPEDQQWTADFQHNKELIANIEVFNTIALRAYRILRKLDPITGEAKAKRAGSKSPRRAKSKSKGATVTAGGKKKKKGTGKKKKAAAEGGDKTAAKKKKKKAVPKKLKSDKTDRAPVKKGTKKKKAPKKEVIHAASPDNGSTAYASPIFAEEEANPHAVHEHNAAADSHEQETPAVATHSNAAEPEPVAAEEEPASPAVAPAEEGIDVSHIQQNDEAEEEPVAAEAEAEAEPAVEEEPVAEPEAEDEPAAEEESAVAAQPEAEPEEAPKEEAEAEVEEAAPADEVAAAEEPADDAANDEIAAEEGEEDVAEKDADAEEAAPAAQNVE